MAHVVVTGGSGFIAGHIISCLLAEGHHVRATLRSLSKGDRVKEIFASQGVQHLENLEFAEAELLKDDGWAEVMRGIDYVVHVASPVHIGKVKDEAEIIAPARSGALRVLQAAVDAGVKRVVLTSAFHAVGFGHGKIDHEYTEADWSPVMGKAMDAYGRSKVYAERAAWDFIKRSGAKTELTTILPVAVMGPMMGNDISGANHVIEQSLTGKMPGYPNMFMPIVDVRDVAAAHVAAMTAPDAAGERIIVANGEPAMPMHEIGEILRESLGDAASKVPTRKLPDLVVKLGALVNPAFKTAADELGYQKRISDRKMRSLLGVEPRSSRTAIIAAGQSMVERGIGQ